MRLPPLQGVQWGLCVEGLPGLCRPPRALAGCLGLSWQRDRMRLSLCTADMVERRAQATQVQATKQLARKVVSPRVEAPLQVFLPPSPWRRRNETHTGRACTFPKSARDVPSRKQLAAQAPVQVTLMKWRLRAAASPDRPGRAARRPPPPPWRWPAAPGHSLFCPHFDCRFIGVSLEEANSFCCSFEEKPRVISLFPQTPSLLFTVNLLLSDLCLPAFHDSSLARLTE